MDNRAIGIFDSGLGGLTAVRAIRELMPEENIIYFADSGRVPYGGRAVDQLRRMTAQDLDFVSSLSVKAIIAACGTASSTAPDVLDNYPIRTFGVLRAAIHAMSLCPGTAPLGVIATEASIRAGTFKRELSALCPGREIIALSCPEFVPLIENGHISAADPELRRAVSDALAPLRERRISALLLGCTHYGIISDAIEEYLGGDVALISAAECAAKQLRDYLVASSLEGCGGELLCFTSGSAAEFDSAATSLLGGTAVRARQVPVMDAD